MRFKLFFLGAALSLSAVAQDVEAPPHSLKGKVDYSKVSLSWKNPSQPNVLQWHNDYSYNGISGIQTNPQGPCTIYAANRFAPSDLIGVTNKKVVSIAYNEYRFISDVTVEIYEDNKMVYSQPVDVIDWVKDEMRNVTLDTPYLIPEGKEVMFVIKKVHGYNQDFAAICDRTVTPGKGNVYSYDGETWFEDAPGDFLITAYIENNADATPEYYNVYFDGEKMNESGIEGTSYTLTNLPEGNHSYSVGAVYANSEKISYELPLTTINIDNLVAPVAGLTGKVKDLEGTLNWHAPLLNSNELTWSGKEFGLSIGGTASSNTKVWIKQEFDEDELYFGSFINNNITAINSYISENSVTGITAFILKDDVIDYYEEIPAAVVSEIQVGNWNKFNLSTPYLIEEGHKYGFGLYYLQTPGTHPVGVDNQTAIVTKANSFSTSSPNNDFATSNPSWRTLSSGDIAGNFMLSADVEPIGSPAETIVIKNYEIYKDGTKIAETQNTEYVDNVESIGKVQYSVVAVSEDGRNSLGRNLNLNYKLPSGYVAPTILGSSFDEKTGKLEFSWSPNAYELRKYNTASYIVGFEEEMDLAWGALFNKEDLADYAGYKVNSITFGIGDDAIGDFELLIFADKQEIFNMPIAAGTIEWGYLYTIKLDQDIFIPEGKDIYLAYRASAPAGSTPIMIDGGPAETGGAKISLTGGVSWMNLSTLNPNWAGYNVVVGAIISPADEANLSPSIEITSTQFAGIFPSNRILISAEDLREMNDMPVSAIGNAPKKNIGRAPKAESFKVYKNGEQIAQISSTEYSEILDEYGYFNYYVKSVFPNGWESASSKNVSVANSIPQKSQAPYNLQGEADYNEDMLRLTWEAIDAPAAVMKYHDENTQNMAFGMTGSGTREGYMAIKLPASNLESKVGSKISHIKFMLNSLELYTASVFIMINEDIIYEQDLNINDLAMGVWNVVRLDREFEIPAGKDILVGYHLTYANGEKPHMTDEGPAIVGYGDIISTSATSGYWYSLKERFNLNYNHRIEAVIKTPDSLVIKNKAGEPQGITYTVKRDGTSIANGITDHSYDVMNPLNGLYTVTAIIGDEESADSNAVEYLDTTNVNIISKDTDNAYYDRAAQSVRLTKADNAYIYNLSGQVVERHINCDNIDLSSLPDGIYIIKTDSGESLKIVK